MKKIYMSEQNYIELNFFGYIMAKKYNYEKLFKKGEEIICRKPSYRDWEMKQTRTGYTKQKKDS